MTLAVPMSRRASVRGAVSPLVGSTAAWAWAASAVLALSLLAAVLGPALHGRPMAPEDDAEYYRVIAAHIARTGVSTFDGQSLTNGYHPLWEAVLVLQDLTVGPSFLVTQLIEVVLVVAAFPLLLRATGLRSALGTVLFLAAYGRWVGGLALTGMEVSALVGCAALAVAAAAPTQREGWGRATALGLAAAAAVLARIDAAVFVLPLVAFAPLRRSTRVGALLVAGAVGAAYAGYNLAMFGTALPLSSTVKSLGGLQVNHRLLDQLAAEWRTQRLGARDLQMFAGLLLSPVALVAAWRRPYARALAAAACVGGAMFAAKLLFASSWRIWPWYDFPLLFSLTALAAAFGPPAERIAAQFTSRTRREAARVGAAAAAVAGAILLALCAKAALVVARRPQPTLTDFAALNAEAGRRWAPVLKAQRVAMGDRAGAFAAVYPGSVVQLEGLVNDREYLAALKRGGDVTLLLCRRGVRFLLAYRPELGPYRVHRMPVMRPTLTQSGGAYVDLDRGDELARLQDRSLLDLRGVDEGDDTLVLWRLGRCARRPA